MTQTLFLEVQMGGYSNKALLEETILSFPKGKRLMVSISDRSSRTTRQNNLWWLYMSILSKETGFYKDEIHSICKMKFLKREKVVESTGEILEYTESTSKLSKEQFGELIDRLIQFAAETFNITLPIPDEQLGINY